MSSWSILVLLLLQLVPAQASLRTLRAHLERQNAASGDTAACACDCCVVQNDNEVQRASASSNATALKCAPRSRTLPLGSGDGGCGDLCTLPRGSALRKGFDAETGEVDYSRYCLSQCRPGSTALNEVCIKPAYVASPETAAPSPKANQAMAQMGMQVNTEAGKAPEASESTIVLLAKEKMNEAKIQAEAAGEAAFNARTAYERLVKAKEEMAQKAAEATLAEIKTEAAAQSKRAADIRTAYETGAQETAKKNAIAAALVYKKALIRDMTLASTWQERAGQLAAAATQREKMAMGFSSDADLFRKRNNIDMAKQRITLAHQAMDQANEFAEKAQSAHKQAQAITDSKPWYLYAERAIAATILAKSMPHDVPPPPMPPLP